MKYFLLFLKGFLIGCAKIMPGVSGAVLAISLGVYERLIYIIGHPFKVKLDDLKFLFFLLLGAGSGIILLCDLIKFFLANYYFITVCFFIGLIIGGLPEIFKKVRNLKFNFLDICIFLFAFCFVILVISLKSSESNNSNYYFVMGVIESLTTIIPGISGTAVFMALGWYENLLVTIKNILTFKSTAYVTFNFIAGFIVSTILISKFLSFAFLKYKKQSYMCILGFLSASIFEMIFKLFSSFNSTNFLFSIPFVYIGYFITSKLDDFFSNN